MNIKKIFKWTLLFLLGIVVIFFLYFFTGKAPDQENIIWGVNFSQKHSQDMGLNWRDNYNALIEDLNVKHIKIATHWDLIEPEKDSFSWEDLDWQLAKAEENDVKVILVLGMKTPRWPECHIPSWAKDLEKQELKERILIMIETMISRYNSSEVIYSWQIENEPFFPFGDCPWFHSREFLKQEVELAKKTDITNKQIIVSDSGEWSFWFRAAKIADMVGTTMYRKVWFSQFSMYVDYPIPPVFYWKRAQLVDKFYNKKVICVEFQAEPWGPSLLYYSPLEEQEKTMNLEQFRNNIEYAKKTGFDQFYLWGAEWWYWMKEKHNQPEIWEEAKKLF